MLIFIVFLVSVNMLMVKTENDVVKVIIREGTAGSCIPYQENELTFGTNFNLEVSSELFIMESKWTHNNVVTVLKDLENSTISLTYNKTNHANGPTVTLKYYYSHTLVFNESIAGNWNFSFTYLNNYDPWRPLHLSNVGNYCTCSISVNNSFPRHASTPSTEDEAGDLKKFDNGVNLPDWVIYVLSFFGLFLVVQSSYIIYGKVKRCRAKRNNDEDPISPKSPKGKRSRTRRNIADRPPLPLPPDEVIQTPPQPPISPGPVHKHLFPTAPPMPLENPYSATLDPVPLVPKPSYRHQGMNTSDKGVTSPVFAKRQQGPLVPKQSYRNKGLLASVEELRTPGSTRRQMDGPLVPKQSYRNKALEASVEELRTPGCVRRHVDGPLVPKQSYRSKALDASLEELRRIPACPRRYMDDPLVPKPTYRNSVCVSDDSDEEHKAPGFARRQIEAKFAQLPQKGVAPSKSFKLPRPLPRSPPSPTLERVPPFNPAHRPEPVPPLHPKKMPVFPPPAPFRKQEPSRMSDDEWQYEHLQPSSKYLNNNFSATNNYNR